MNLTEQTVNGTNQVNITDSLNSALMELKIKRKEDTTVPESNELIVYVDQSSSENPTESKKQYVYDLIRPLDFYNEISDEFLIRLGVRNNNVYMETLVKRMIGETEENKYVLEEPIYEILESSQIILFEGTNFIYTNYANADITLVYPKDNAFNKLYLNSSIYAKDKENHEKHTLEEIYYSSCFTKTESKINLDVNNINIDCITSKNNKFSLDENGNLIVNTITVADPISSTELLNIYPIGSIYMNVNNVEPSILFGGIWEKIEERFLLASGSTITNGSLGGEASHQLTVAEMPTHSHEFTGTKGFYGTNSGTYNVLYDSSVATKLSHVNNTSTGGNKAHNNMPPYLAVNMWKRIA